MTIANYRPAPRFVTPFSDLMNGLFNHDIAHIVGHDDVERDRHAVNIIERERAFELLLVAPGFTKLDLKIGVEKDVLTVSAEKKHEAPKEKERYTRREFSLQGFNRSFRLPETVNAEEITAEFNDGVLHLTIPKAEQTKPRARQISIA